MFEGKAQADEKAEHTRQYMSILNRIATQLSGIRWGYETGSKKNPSLGSSIPDEGFPNQY